MEPFVIVTAAVIASFCIPSLWLILGNLRYLKDTPVALTSPTISIIIPARDEEGNLGPLLDSIQSQELKPHEIIVIDDHSSDNTASIATKGGAHVLSARELPSGWKGKPWACQQGADHASGEWNLFLDADTRLQPQALSHLAGVISLTKQKSVISIIPFHTIKKPYEELSVFFNMLMIAGVNAFGRGPGSQGKAALFGQSLLISKHHYHQVGGHQSVKSHILENFHLAQELDKLGIKRSCYLGKGVLTMRMFPEGFKDLWNSWKKGFSSGAAQTAARALAFSSIWITGAIIATISLLFAIGSGSSSVTLLAAIIYLTYAAQCLHIFRRIGSYSPLNAIFFPITLLFYQILFFSSTYSKRAGKSTQWKGRDVL